MPEDVQYWVAIPAAGIGKRVGADKPKQYIEIHGKTVLEHTIECFINRDDIAGIAVAVASDDCFWPGLAISAHEKLIVAPGGKERFNSVTNALLSLADRAHSNDWVLVHDAARPCLSQQALDRLIHALDGHKIGGILGLPCRDTMKRANCDNEITETVERDNLWHAQTPQMFRYQKLLDALQHVLAKGLVVTDEAMAIELQGYCPRLVEGHHENIKITHKDDLKQAETYLK